MTEHEADGDKQCTVKMDMEGLGHMELFESVLYELEDLTRCFGSRQKSEEMLREVRQMNHDLKMEGAGKTAVVMVSLGGTERLSPKEEALYFDVEIHDMNAHEAAEDVVESVIEIVEAEIGSVEYPLATYGHDSLSKLHRLSNLFASRSAINMVFEVVVTLEDQRGDDDGE